MWCIFFVVSFSYFSSNLKLMWTLCVKWRIYIHFGSVMTSSHFSRSPTAENNITAFATLHSPFISQLFHNYSRHWPSQFSCAPLKMAESTNENTLKFVISKFGNKKLVDSENNQYQHDGKSKSGSIYYRCCLRTSGCPGKIRRAKRKASERLNN